jgi:hypothetical protein
MWSPTGSHGDRVGMQGAVHAATAPMTPCVGGSALGRHALGGQRRAQPVCVRAEPDQRAAPSGPAG